jgi:putative membrane protein
MTKVNLLKNGMLAVVLGFASATAAAQNGNMDAGDFLEDATAKGIAEIEAGRQALENSENSRVQSFAQTMIDDHTRMNEELRAIAREKNLEVADDATLMDQGKVMIMQLRSGDGFDRHYMGNQVNAHEQTIELYENASQNLADQELREKASDSLPKLREHLAKAQELHSALEAQDENDDN